MKHYLEKAFTLVELLIVIGIIGILAVTLMVTLNPAEAQRKSRDAKRLKDIQNLQAIVEQALSDGVILAAQAGALRTSFAAGRLQQQPCAVNFLGVNLCTYAKVIPVDPLNGTNGRCVDGTTRQLTPGNTCAFAYYSWIDTNLVDYELNARLESVSNTARLLQDGGNSNWMVEVFSNVNTLIGNAQNP